MLGSGLRAGLAAEDPPPFLLGGMVKLGLVDRKPKHPKLLAPSRDGDCDQAAGPAGVQLETAAITVSPRCPAAVPLVTACGR